MRDVEELTFLIIITIFLNNGTLLQYKCLWASIGVSRLLTRLMWVFKMCDVYYVWIRLELAQNMIDNLENFKRFKRSINLFLILVINILNKYTNPQFVEFMSCFWLRASNQ